MVISSAPPPPPQPPPHKINRSLLYPSLCCHHRSLQRRPYFPFWQLELEDPVSCMAPLTASVSTLGESRNTSSPAKFQAEKRCSISSFHGDSRHGC